MSRYIRNYEVIRELGAGHFGTVYLAVGEVPGRGRVPGKRRLVAIKKLKKGATDREAVDLLLQEFSLLDQVKHRGIVRVFEYLEEENAVVMEYIHGVTLRRVLEELDRAHEQVFTEAAVEIGCELADALYQAHTTPGDNGEPLQLVHRDLKPANVMLTPTGEVKILDFGLARVDNADFARDNPERIRGTPIYMAPEQARGQVLDHRTDLFAMGLILYELLEKEPAYRVPDNARDPMREIFGRIERGDLQEPCRALESRLPALGPVITRTLRPRPEDRYRNGHDLLVDLRRQLYRDRGAYLQEFCDFFFGMICELGEAPSLESVEAATGGARRPTKSRQSIEDRLRESMARDNRASAQSGRPAAPASNGAPMSANRGDDGDGGRRRPPVGGGASRATPFVPPAAGGTDRSREPSLKVVGARDPGETGLLPMVPLSTDGDGNEVAADPSATAFFAIPAPKSGRSAPAMGGMGGGGAPPPPPTLGQGPVFGSQASGDGGMGGGMGGGMAPSAPPPPRPSYGQGIGMGNAGGGGAIAHGPIAQMGNVGGGSPFVAAGPVPGTATDPEESRSRSYQVFALVFGMLVMVCLLVVVAVGLVVYNQDGLLRPPDGGEIARTTTPPPPEPEDEEEFVEELPPPPPVPQPRNPQPRNPNPPPPRDNTPKPPAVASGTVTVSLNDPTGQINKVQAICSGSTTGRVNISNGGTASVKVTGSDCKLSFGTQGGTSIKTSSSIGSGRSVRCTVNGNVVSCG